MDVSMTDGVLALMTPYLAATAAGSTPEPGNDLLTGGWARYGLHRCRDGKLLALAAIEDQFWNKLGDLLGQEVPQDETQLAAIFATRDRDD